MLGWNKLLSKQKGVRNVDKPKKGHTITIKLNGEKKKHQEKQKKSEAKPIKNIAIKSEEEPIEKSTPKVILPDPSEDVLLETAAAQESFDESFDWIIPETAEHDIDEFHFSKPKNPKKSTRKIGTSFSSHFKKKSGRPIGPIFISALFAILIGTTIGVFMLKLVITDTGQKAATNPKEVEETAGTEKPSGKTTSVSLEQLTTYVVQGGFYTSKDGAKGVADQISAKGIPSQVIEISGKHYIFLGVADSLETAKTVGGQFKGNGVEDAFAKPLLVDGKQINDLTEKEKAFVEAVPTIYQTLSTVTSSAMTANTISEDAAKSLATVDQQLKTNSIKNEQVKNLKAELTKADEKVKAYQTSEDKKNLMEAQQHLLNFLSYYYSM